MILGVFGGTYSTYGIGGKFGFLSGFTKNLLRGLTENQESNECDSVNIPKVLANSSKGDGKGRAVNNPKLSSIGQSGEPKVNSIKSPPGNKKYDTTGLDEKDIEIAVKEEKDFLKANNVNYENSKIINETDSEKDNLENILEFD